MDPFEPDIPDELAALAGAGDEGAEGPPLIQPRPEPESGADADRDTTEPAAAAPRPARPAEPPRPPRYGDSDPRMFERIDRGVGAMSSDVEQIRAELAAINRSLLLTQLCIAILALAILALARKHLPAPDGGLLDGLARTAP